MDINDIVSEDEEIKHRLRASRDGTTGVVTITDERLIFNPDTSTMSSTSGFVDVSLDSINTSEIVNKRWNTELTIGGGLTALAFGVGFAGLPLTAVITFLLSLLTLAIGASKLSTGLHISTPSGAFLFETKNQDAMVEATRHIRGGN